MRIVGHRGAAAVAPENTIEGIRRAFIDGADAVEVDLRLTVDGILVLVHDESPERTRGLAGRVQDLKADALRHAGVPTLDEAWNAANGRMILEMKGAWGSDEQAAVAVRLAAFLRGRDHSHTVVSSFDVLALSVFRDAGGIAPTGVLTAAAIDPDAAIEATTGGGHAVCFLPDAVCDIAVLDRARAAGRQVVVWTVNDPERIRHLAVAGADGIITDDPAAARLALGE